MCRRIVTDYLLLSIRCTGGLTPPHIAAGANLIAVGGYIAAAKWGVLLAP